MRPRPVLFVIPTLDAGGMTTRFETFAGELRRRGHATTFITAPGAETERTRAASRVIEADWQALGPAGIARIVRDAVGAHAWTVIACAPELLDAIPDALAGPLHLCVHSVPDALEGWYATEELAAFRVLLAAALRSGRASISAASPRQAADHAAGPAKRALLSGLAEHAAAARAGAKASEALGHELWTELELARGAARGVRGALAGQNEDEPPSGRLV